MTYPPSAITELVPMMTLLHRDIIANTAASLTTVVLMSASTNDFASSCPCKKKKFGYIWIQLERLSEEMAKGQQIYGFVKIAIT